MKNQLNPILFFVLLLSLGSCMTPFSGVKGNSNVVTETRDIDEKFNSVSAATGLKVKIVQSSSVEVIVEADENLMDIIKTEVKDGVLKIYSEKNIWSAKAKNIYVQMPEITSVAASSGSSVKSESLIKTGNFSVDTSSGSSVSLELSADAVRADASSGSTMRLSGKANSIMAEASSGSSIKSTDLSTNDASARVSSGASIKVHTTNKLKARASSGGGIRYSGNPEYVDRDSSSGGSISGSK